ncbi:MAG: ABC transporter ATP-binding protein [Nitrososphaerota archaeon]|nr:ABC transporter ATP-binding protein [Nitrososphaerota archaeon]
MLQVKGITKKFGGVAALNSVSFDVGKGEVFAIIGPNGSGKTTLFNVVAGFHKPDGGSISFEGKDITGWQPFRVAQAGIARSFQNTRPFPDLTTLDNVVVGALTRHRNIREARSKAEEVMATVGLGGAAGMQAKNLSIQDRKRLEVAKAIATSPRLLLLDEPMAGLTGEEIPDFVSLIKRLNESGMTILLIEHVLYAITKVADRLMVMDNGNKLAEGAPGDIMNDSRVLKAYIGEDDA